MSHQLLEGSDAIVRNGLSRLFESHGISTEITGNRLLFPDHPRLAMNGAIFRFTPKVIQLDIRLQGFDGDRVLIESIAGIGETDEEQIQRAFQAIANGSFHVILSAFFDQPESHGTSCQTWELGGEPREIHRGLITTIFGYPQEEGSDQPWLGFYPIFKTRLEELGLPEGIHWIRIYQSRRGPQVLCNEVLLDNQPWAEMQGLMEAVEWPVIERAFDVRLFLVVKPGS